jgi:hypothetical protein
LHDGIMNRPNLNPRAINHGAIDDNGRLKIQPIITAQNPSSIQALIESERNIVRETMYINLFQILVDQPNMTATEAMIRANEKGELLGPAGVKIQNALSHMVDNEVSILTNHGAFNPDGPLAVPESLGNESVGARFTSPLDRLRSAQELLGTQRLLEMFLPLAKAKPEILDRFDFDEMIKIATHANGAPQRSLMRDDEVNAMRQQRKQTEQMAQTVEMAKQAGEAGQAALPAIDMAQQMGLVPGAA